MRQGQSVSDAHGTETISSTAPSLSHISVTEGNAGAFAQKKGTGKLLVRRTGTRFADWRWSH